MVRTVMLHSAFEVGGHHGQRLAGSHLPARVVVRHVDRSAGIVCVDHTATRLLVLRLLLDGTGAIGRLVVASRAALRTTLVVVRAVVVVPDHAGTVHDRVLVAYFFDGWELLQKETGQFNYHFT
jgi:hypothetical protein